MSQKAIWNCHTNVTLSIEIEAPKDADEYEVGLLALKKLKEMNGKITIKNVGDCDFECIPEGD